MYTIAICDDDDNALRMLDIMCKRNFAVYGKNVEIQTFNRSVMLLEEIEKKRFDIVFLDIDMPEVMGTEIAEKIIEMNARTIILFVSNYETVVFDTFQYSPFRFLRKMHLGEELPAAIRDLNKKLNSEKKYIEYADTHKVWMIEYANIIDICAQKHGSSIRYINMDHLETCVTRKALKEYEALLKNENFIKIHSGCLVNVCHITRVNGRTITLDTGEELLAARSRQTEVEKSFLRYIREMTACR